MTCRVRWWETDMGLFDGLEKFGLKLEKEDIFAEEAVSAEDKVSALETPEIKAEHREEEFLLSRTVECPVCEKKFPVVMVKHGRLRRMEPDFDLRPRYQYVDVNKYDVTSCPNCGYASMNRYFSHITAGQIRMIREEVVSRFQPEEEQTPVSSYTYEQAVERCKLALYNAVVKKGRASEKAYTCLKLSWVYRGWLESREAEGISDEELAASCRKEEQLYYEQAYDGFMKALASESFPMCGMDENTMNLLMANMAFRLGKTETASKLVSQILVSRVASAKVKDRARDLKHEIIAKIHRGDR